MPVREIVQLPLTLHRDPDASWHEGNFHLLHDEPNTWQHSFGEALDAYPYVVPDVSKLAWPEVLKALPIWSRLFGRTA